MPNTIRRDCPGPEGIGPDSSFPHSDRLVRPERLASQAGKPPVRSLPPRSRRSRSERSLSSGGTGPVNWLPQRLRLVKLAKPPNSAGRLPVNPFWPKTIPETRLSPSVVTPCHSPMGASVSQLVLLVQLAPSVPRRARSISLGPSPLVSMWRRTRESRSAQTSAWPSDREYWSVSEYSSVPA